MTTRFYPFQNDTARKIVRDGLQGAEAWTTESSDGKLFAFGWRSEKQVKHDFYHRFKDENDRDKFIESWFDQLERAATAKQKYLGKRREQNAQPNPVNLGDIFVNSWGYDQTNVDFYQVVGITPKGVKLREIGSQSVANSQGDMTDRVVAAKDRFKDEVILAKRLYFSGGKPCVNMDHGHCGLWNGQPEYESSYH